MIDPSHFIRMNTAILAPPLVPEVRLQLATEVMPLWRKTEEELAEQDVPPPYWAFAWAGGQALARYVLDNRDEVAGKRVLDFGSGSGLVAIAAAKAGAASVCAADIDVFAQAAIAMNAQANGISVEIVAENVIGQNGNWQTILCGDMCYERPLAEALLAWLAQCVRDGKRVLLGDPGRSYFAKSGVTTLATYRVHTTRELEDLEIRETGVFELTA